MKLPLEDDQHCFVCGEKNPNGLHLRFVRTGEKVSAVFIPQKIHQGYKNITHGGLLSTILDEAMVKSALMQGFPAVTVELTVRFKNPLLTGESAKVEAMIMNANRKIIEAAAVITKDELIIAEATAKLLRQGY